MEILSSATVDKDTHKGGGNDSSSDREDLIMGAVLATLAGPVAAWFAKTLGLCSCTLCGFAVSTAVDVAVTVARNGRAGRAIKEEKMNGRMKD